MTGKVVYVRKVDPATGEWAELPEFYIDGKRVSRRQYRKAFPDQTPGARALRGGAGYPKKSVALAVHPDQVKEANDRNERAGIACRYDAEGTCEIPSRAEQKKLVKLEGFVNKDGGYGD